MSNIKIAEIWEKNCGNLGKNCGNLGKKSNIKSAEIWENNAEIWQLQDLLAEIWQLIDCGNLATYCGNMNASHPNTQSWTSHFRCSFGKAREESKITATLTIPVLA
jgi:hypothetical protein